MSRPYVLAVVGSRNYPRLDLVEEFVRRQPRETVILSGGARGVDGRASGVARHLGMGALVAHAAWWIHGRSAGPIRNKLLVSLADEVVAFWDGESKGTANTIELARAAKKLSRVFGPDGQEVKP